MSKPDDKTFHFPTAANPDVENETVETADVEPTEGAIDQGVEESFPASDPVSVSITKIERKDDDEAGQDGASKST